MIAGIGRIWCSGLWCVLPLLAACQLSQVPGCTDKEVTDVVTEITADALKDKTLVQFVVLRQDLMGPVLSMSPMLVASMDYASWSQYRDSSAPMGRLLDAVDHSVETAMAGMQLQYVRMTEKNPDVGKVECSAELVFANGHQTPIDYVAQSTDDGVYVEVFGLDDD